MDFSFRDPSISCLQKTHFMRKDTNRTEGEKDGKIHSVQMEMIRKLV